MQHDFSTSDDLSLADSKAVDRLWTVLADLQIVDAPKVEELIEPEPPKVEIPPYVPFRIAPLPPRVPIPQDSIATSEAFEQLQALLVDPKLNQLKQELDQLSTQIREPDELMALLMPWVAELLKRKVEESQEEVGNAIAPTMGKAIKKQIEIEQDAIVDALYPIIGGTISKYLAETVRAINEQIENTLSVEGIKRKITARIKGVSEAELILKEAMPLKIQAVFLIHKASGLVISEIQGAGDQQLDSDMLAGMLTAIRSFANDCIVQAGQSSELNEIDYGRSKIILEVAGYCYLAIVIQGEPTQLFLAEVRQVLKTLVQQQGTAIATFEGDYDQVSATVPKILETLFEQGFQQEEKKKPPIAAILGVGLFLSIAIPWGISIYHEQLQQRILTAIDKTPELAIYHLEPEVHFGKVKLGGRLPNLPLREQVEQVTREALPNWSIENEITIVDVPADLVLTAAEVKRVTTVLNQSLGIVLTAHYQSEQVMIEGTVPQANDVKRITQAYQQIPGVKSVLSAVRVKPLVKEFRIYFTVDSDGLERSGNAEKLRSFLQQHRQWQFKVVGYSNDVALALSRAKAVQKLLIQKGVPANRIQISALDQSPPGVNANQPEWMNRSAIVEARPLF